VQTDKQRHTTSQCDSPGVLLLFNVLTYNASRQPTLQVPVCVCATRRANSISSSSSKHGDATDAGSRRPLSPPLSVAASYTPAAGQAARHLASGGSTLTSQSGQVCYPINSRRPPQAPTSRDDATQRSAALLCSADDALPSYVATLVASHARGLRT